MLGVFRYGHAQPLAGPGFVGSISGQEVTLHGTVISEPDVRISNAKLTIGGLRSVRGQVLWGKVLLTIPLYPEFRFGDVVRVQCQLDHPEPFDGFAYDRYLARSDIFAVCYYPTVTVVEQGRGDPVRSAIFTFKARLQQVINRGLPEPQASLLSSIILGSRRGLPATLVDDFNATGLTHLVAISGAQITLVVNLLRALLPYLGVHRRKSFYLISVSLAAYLVLIGAPASAVRAGLMGWLLLFAAHVGRLPQAWRLLLYAAVAMVAVNPKILRDDVGFQLSFAAVAGLIYLQPVLERLFSWVPERGGLRVALAMTLAANLFTLPLVSAQFGRVSLVSPLANVLVFPVSAFVMVAGILALPVAWVVPLALAWLPFLPAYFPLAYLTSVAEHLRRLPLAQTGFQLPILLLLPAYLGLAWLTARLKRWLEERERYALRERKA